MGRIWAALNLENRVPSRVLGTETCCPWSPAESERQYLATFQRTWSSCMAQSCGTDPHARPGTVNRMAVVGILFQCLATVDWLSLRFTPDWTPRTQLMRCSLWISNAMRVVGWTGESRVGG